MQDNSKPIPVKDVLADPNHPAYPAACEMMEKLRTGAISMCACLGAAPGEPYCPCEMERRGLEPSPARQQSTEEANQRMRDLVNSGALSRKG
jgi:hypothetical protein